MLSNSTVDTAIDARNSITDLQIAAAQGKTELIRTQVQKVMLKIGDLASTDFPTNEVVYWIEEATIAFKAAYANPDDYKERDDQVRELATVAITLTAEIDTKGSFDQQLKFYGKTLHYALKQVSDIKHIESELAIGMLRDDFLIALVDEGENRLVNSLSPDINKFIEALDVYELTGGFQRV